MTDQLAGEDVPLYVFYGLIVAFTFTRKIYVSDKAAVAILSWHSVSAHDELHGCYHKFLWQSIKDRENPSRRPQIATCPNHFEIAVNFY